MPFSTEIEVVNKGTAPSVVVAILVKKPDGNLIVYRDPPAPIGAFESRSFIVFATGEDRIGVLTQFGNVFWVR